MSEAWDKGARRRPRDQVAQVRSLARRALTRLGGADFTRGYLHRGEIRAAVVDDVRIVVPIVCGRSEHVDVAVDSPDNADIAVIVLR